MIENQDGTFTWETGDIITAEKMNKLLEKNTCHIVELELKRNEGDTVDHIEASYNDLLYCIKNNKIIYIKTPSIVDSMGNGYTLLNCLSIDNNSSQPIWAARFTGSSFDSSIGPDSYLYRVSTL